METDVCLIYSFVILIEHSIVIPHFHQITKKKLLYNLLKKLKNYKL